MDFLGYKKLNTTTDDYSEYLKGRWRYVLFPCEECGTETFKRKDVYGRQKKCRSCASKERMKSHSLREKLSIANKTHGQSNSLTWKSWSRMRRRIRVGSNHHPTYEEMYIDPRWHSYETFLADMGERPSSKHTIDRIDNSKGYYKENCRWATSCQQARNRSSNKLLTHRGKTMTLIEWSEETGLTRSCIESRLKRRWSVEETLDLPNGAKGHNRYAKG